MALSGAAFGFHKTKRKKTKNDPVFSVGKYILPWMIVRSFINLVFDQFNYSNDKKSSTNKYLDMRNISICDYITISYIYKS